MYQTQTQWCRANPDKVYALHETQGARAGCFLAIAPDGDVVIAEQEESTFEAELNELRPSIRKLLFCTHTVLWVPGTADA